MAKIFTIHAPRQQKETRLDVLLRTALPSLLGREVSNSKLRRLIMAGMVRVDGVQRRVPAFAVRACASVSVAVDEEKLFYEKDAGDIAFELTARDVLFEDDDIIVVNKPAFFPTEAGMVESRDNLHAAVIRYLWQKQPQLKNPPYAGIMHRLDRETSGVILFTKRRSANAACHAMFEEHTARKVYYALCTQAQNAARAKNAVSACAVGDTFSVDMPMGRISGKSQAAKWGRVSENAGGVPSHTEFAVLSQDMLSAPTALHKPAGASRAVLLIEARPLTGRTHQIRVHLASVGLPILGDTLYGGKEAPRIYLHARSLTFPHPATGAEITIGAPLPPEFSVAAR